MNQNVSSSRDWRQQEEQTSSAKWISVSLLIVATIGLVALFIWILWPEPQRSGSLLVIGSGTVYPDNVGIPSSSTVASPWEKDGVPFHFDHRDFQGKASLESFKRNLLVDGVDEPDVSILFLIGHGVSRIQNMEDGLGAEAYLLAASFSYDNPQEVPVREFIEALSEQNSETKLLILDTSFMLENVRYGMGINEFPAIVEQAVREIDDPDLWVILSAGMLELSNVAYNSSMAESVFTTAIRETLTELGDQKNRSDSGEVDLLTFHRRVSQRCLTATYDRQRPVLLRGGMGFVDETDESNDAVQAAEDTFLFFSALQLPEPKSEESDDDDESASIDRSSSVQRYASLAQAALPHVVQQLSAAANINIATGDLTHASRALSTGSRRRIPSNLQDDDSTSDQENSDDDDSDPDGDSDDSNDAGSDADDAEGTGVVEPVTPSQRRRERLDSLMTELGEESISELDRKIFEIRLLMEQIHHRDNSSNWSPVDFAPDEWHQQMQTLRWLTERAQHVQPGSQEYGDRLSEANELTSSLEALIQLLNQANSSRSSSDPLLTAWDDLRRANGGDLATTWEPTGDLNVQLILIAFREYYDVSFRARYFVEVYNDLSAIRDVDIIPAIEFLLREIASQQPLFESDFEFGNLNEGLSREAPQFIQARDRLRSAEQAAYEELFKSVSRTVNVAIANGDYLMAQALLFKLAQSPLVPLFGLYGNDDYLIRTESGDASSMYASYEAIFRKCRELRTLELRPLPRANLYDRPEDLNYFYGQSDAWSRAINRLELQYLFLETQIGFISTSSHVGSMRGELRNGIDATTVANLLKHNREATQEISQAYSSAIARTEIGDISQLDTNVWSRRLSAIADPRFDEGRQFGASELPLLGFTEKEEQPEVSFPDLPDGAIQMTEPVESYVIDIETSGFNRRSIDLSVIGLNNDVFEIDYVGTDRVPLSEGAKFSVPLDNEGRGEISFEIRALHHMAAIEADPRLAAYTSNEPSLYLRVEGIEIEYDPYDESVDATVDKREARININPHRPQWVDLIVRHQSTGIWEPSTLDDDSQLSIDENWNNPAAFPSEHEIPCIRIKQFAGVESLFDFYAVNRSGKPITATINLYPVDRNRLSEGDNFPIGLLPGRVSNGADYDARKEVRDRMIALLEDRTRLPGNRRLLPFATATVELGPNLRTVNEIEDVFSLTTDFAKLVLLANPPSESDEPPADPLPIDVSHGVLCVIEIDGWDGGQRRQLNWLEFETTMPDDILAVGLGDVGEAAEVRHDRADGTIQLSLRPEFRDPKWRSISPVDIYGPIDVSFDGQSTGDSTFRIAEPRSQLIENRDQTISFEWNRTSGQGSEIYRFFLDVAGFPRALAYEVDTRTSGPGTFVRRNMSVSSNELRIRQIQPLSDVIEFEPRMGNELDTIHWFPEINGAVFDFAVDLPLSQILQLNPDQIESEARIELEIAGQKHLYYFDRQLTTSMTATEDGLLLRTDVNDLSLEFDRLPRDESINVEISAFLQDRETAVVMNQQVGIDTLRPRITSFEFRDGDFVGGPRRKRFTPADGVVSVQLKVEDTGSGIAPAFVFLYKDLIANPSTQRWEFVDDKIIISGATHSMVIREEGDEFVIDIDIPLNEDMFSEGTNSLIPLVSDRVGLLSQFPVDRVAGLEPLKVEFSIPEVDPDDMGDPDDGNSDLPESYEIRFQLEFSTGKALDSLSRTSVKLNGAQVTPESLGGNNFVIKDLEPGEYEIVVEYSGRDDYSAEPPAVTIDADEEEPIVELGLIVLER